MNQQYLLAIDAGTGSIRAVLFDTLGQQIDCVQEEWEHREDPRWPGSMDFDWKSNWESSANCIKRLIEKTSINPKSIAGISTTCMREGIVLYNKEGKEIWACANVDSRSTDEVAELIQQNPELQDRPMHLALFPVFSGLKISFRKSIKKLPHSVCSMIG